MRTTSLRPLPLALAIGLAFLAAAGRPAGASAVAALPESVMDQGAVLAGSSPVVANLPGTDAVSPADLRISAGGQELSLTGTLGEGVADRTAALLAANPGIVRLRLTSDGGLVEEAEALGRVVAVHGLSTSVTEDCASACTLVFVRGYRRHLGRHGRLGFHGPYVIGFLDKARSVDASSERHAYIRAGLSPEFVARALAGAPEAMWFPTKARLRAVGVVTDGAWEGRPQATAPVRRHSAR